MRGMYQALRDGSTTVEEMFDPRRMTGTAFEKVENPLGEEVTDNAVLVDAETGEIRPMPPRNVAPEKPARRRGRPATKEKQTAAKPAEEPAGVIAPQPSPPPVQAIPIGGSVTSAGGLGLATPELKNEPSSIMPGYVTHLAPPRNVSEYHRYARAWLADVKDAAELEARWQSEKDLRGKCSVIGEDLDAIFELKLARVKQLAK